MSSENIFLRKAQKDDVLILFCWVNDPVVRQSAFCTDDIPSKLYLIIILIIL